MTTFKYIDLDIDPQGILTVTMNRPPVNAVDRDMYIEIAECLSDPDAAAGRQVSCIILAGAGKDFCAGNDLDEFLNMSPENGTERMWRVRSAFFAIQDCKVPVIGAVQGSALGTGLAIAASCDFVVAADNARFGLPELTVGVMGGARHLARMAPQPLVRRMFFTGEHINAIDFAAAGGAIVVCPSEELLDRARHYAMRVASFSPTAVRLSKQILGRIEIMDLQTGYEFEQRYTVQMSGHPDSKEAIRAFREKRPANYSPLPA